jgi:tetratricopeptide (TPR) repeat protein
VTRAEVIDHLDALVSKNLVQFDGSTCEGRYRLLETLRDFAVAELRARGAAEWAEAHDAHRRYYSALALTAAGHLTGPEQAQWLERLTVEHDNLRAALTGHLSDPDPDPGLRMASALVRFWRARGHGVEGARILEAHLAHSPAGEPSFARGLALAAFGYLLAGVLGEYDRALVHAREACAIARAVGDRRLEGEAVKLMALVAVRQGRFSDALSIGDDAIVLARSLHDAVLIAELANVRGAALINLGRDARPAFEESLTVSRRAGDWNGIATALNNLGAIDVTAGDLAIGRSRLEEALRIYRDQGLRQNAASAAINLGFTCYREGDRGSSRLHFESALDSAQRVADPGLIALALCGLALTCPDPVTAATLHGAADAIMTQIGYHLEHVEAPLHAADQARLKETLGEQEFSDRHRAGRKLARADAIAVALTSGVPAPLTGAAAL